MLLHRSRVSRLAGLVVLCVLAPFAAACAESAPASTPARDLLTSIPWAADERYEYVLTAEDGTEIGRGVLSVREEGRHFVLDQVYTESSPPEGMPPTSDEISVTVDAATLLPVEGERTTVRRDPAGATSTERLAWAYRDDEGGMRLIETVSAVEGRDPEQRQARVQAAAYDNESSLWLWRGFAFEEEYHGEYASVNPLDRSQQMVDVRVPHRETVETPAGTFETWRLLLRSGRAARTAWVNVEPPYQVVRWDNGDLIFDLLPGESR